LKLEEEKEKKKNSKDFKEDVERKVISLSSIFSLLITIELSRKRL